MSVSTALYLSILAFLSWHEVLESVEHILKEDHASRLSSPTPPTPIAGGSAIKYILQSFTWW
jgi:hypothetical protein